MTMADGVAEVSEAVLMAEEAVIAACLLDCWCCDRASCGHEHYEPSCSYLLCSRIIDGGDFWTESLRWCWEGIALLHRRGEPVSVITLALVLDQPPYPHRYSGTRLRQMGGEPGLQEIVNHWFTAIGVEAHARIVKQASERRTRLVEIGKEAARVARGDWAPSGGVSLEFDE